MRIFRLLLPHTVSEPGACWWFLLSFQHSSVKKDSQLTFVERQRDLIENIFKLFYHYFWLKSQRVIPSIHSVLKDVSNRNRKLINDDVVINIITMHCWEFIGTGTVLPLTASYQSAVPIEKMFDAAECWHLRGHKVGSS